jgi:hypothetical protein
VNTILLPLPNLVGTPTSYISYATSVILVVILIFSLFKARDPVNKYFDNVQSIKSNWANDTFQRIGRLSQALKADVVLDILESSSETAHQVNPEAVAQQIIETAVQEEVPEKEGPIEQ